MVNSQNNCWLALSPQDVLILMKTKYQVHIRAFGMVTSNGDLIPPFIFPYGIRLNKEAYIKCLEEIVMPWIKREEDPISDKRTVICDSSRRT